MNPKPERHARGGDPFVIKILLWLRVRERFSLKGETTNSFDISVDNVGVMHILQTLGYSV